MTVMCDSTLMTSDNTVYDQNQKKHSLYSAIYRKKKPESHGW